MISYGHYIFMSKDAQEQFNALSDNEKYILASMWAENMRETQLKIIQQMEEQVKLKE